ncbi:MAG: MATE family efflux transporter [Kiritimatiellae bacterium]|nr:MATE family efflux transporter [Kiritimatiellia bacterium]
MSFPKENDHTRELATARLGPLLFKYSWPALVAMSLNALYSVIDRFYIGCGCGEDAMASLTLTFPVMMLLGAFGIFVGSGHSAVLSIRLGEGNKRACEKLLGQLVAFKILFFLVLPPLIFFNVDTVLNLCGGDKVSSVAFAGARNYLRLVVFSHIFSHLAFGLSAMMRAQGNAVNSMVCMVVGFGANLVLDPVFIFGATVPVIGVKIPAYGIEGAAWATNIAMFLSFLWAARYYLSGKSVVKFRVRDVRFHRGLLIKPLGIGLSPFLQHVMGSLINLSLAAAFACWSSDSGGATRQIASLGVFQSVMILVIMPILGTQQGLQPIFGYNWGARNFARVRETFFLGFAITTILCVIACMIQVIPPLPKLLASIFVDSSNLQLLKTASNDLMIANCMLWTISVNVLATTYFQSIGHPKTAIFLSMLRQGVCLLPCIWILPAIGAKTGLFAPELGIWIALPVSDVLCQLATLPPLFSHIRFLSRKSPSKAVAPWSLPIFRMTKCVYPR